MLYSGSLEFQGRQSGGVSNVLYERLRIILLPKSFLKTRMGTQH